MLRLLLPAVYQLLGGSSCWEEMATTQIVSLDCLFLQAIFHSFWVEGLLVLFLACTLSSTTDAQFTNGQFNEARGQRREQTFKVLEFENSNINQRYPGTLRYYCTFRGKWSEERHPNDFPRYPSWSAPVLISHSNGYRMWTGTETATLGVESIAEVRTFLCPFL